MSSWRHGPRSPRPWYLKWQFPTPSAATHEVWERRERYMRKNHPIVTIFQMTIPRFVRRRIHIVKEFVWAIRHRTINRYDVVKLRSLKPGYHDSDTRMLAACFDLMCVYVEHKVDVYDLKNVEKLIAKLNEWHVETQEDHYAELAVLYWWWMIERPQRARASISETSVDIHMATEEFYRDQDDGMLARLLAIRDRLW